MCRVMHEGHVSSQEAGGFFFLLCSGTARETSTRYEPADRQVGRGAVFGGISLIYDVRRAPAFPSPARLGGGGQSHFYTPISVVALAYLYPSANFVALDMRPRAVDVLRERASALQNLEAMVGRIEHYRGPCDVAISLHACGVASDDVIELAVGEKQKDHTPSHTSPNPPPRARCAVCHIPLLHRESKPRIGDDGAAQVKMAFERDGSFGGRWRRGCGDLANAGEAC